MQDPGQILVVGAGVFGLSAALELRRRGQAVTLMDPGPLPRPQAASTDLCKVVRSSYGADEVMTGLALAAVQGWQRWNKLSQHPLFHGTGVLLLTRQPMAPGGYEHGSRRLADQLGQPLQTLRGAQITERFPAWAPGVHAEAIYAPGEGWAQASDSMAWLLERNRAAGVRVLERTTITSWITDPGGTQPVSEPLPEGALLGAVTDSGQVIRASTVLATAGSWTPALLPHTAGLLRAVGQPLLHLRPTNAQRWAAPHFCTWAADVTSSGYYGFPLLPDGTVKVAHHGAGSPIDPEQPAQVPADFEARTRAFLSEVLPELADAPLDRTRLCPYCDTADGRFLIDRDPRRPGLMLATGGSGHAFKFAPVLGELVAEAWAGRPHPAFAWRDGRAGSGADGARARA